LPHRFLHLLWSLVRFRYRLVWAGARTGSGRFALFFLLYVLLAIFGLFFVLGGFGAAVAGVQLGEGEAITRGVLTGLLVSAITTSLFFGIGSRAAFSDAALRRFPLSSTERLAVASPHRLFDPYGSCSLRPRSDSRLVWRSPVRDRLSLGWWRLRYSLSPVTS
jgi:hypothetical protein